MARELKQKLNKVGKLRLLNILRYLPLSKSAYYRLKDMKEKRESKEIKITSAQREKIKETATGEHKRCGYKKIHHILRREGEEISRKIVYQVMKEEGLLQSRKRNKKEKKKYIQRLKELIPDKPNGLWQMDVTYTYVPGYGYWYVIDVIDYRSRYVLVTYFTQSYTAKEGIRALKEAIAEAKRIHGKIKEEIILVTDNGTTFTANRFRRDITEEIENSLKHIRIGHRMPKHIGIIERFHGNLKEEAIYYEYPETPYETREVVNEYRNYYNYERPHWGISLKTPIEAYTELDYQETRTYKQKVAKVA